MKKIYFFTASQVPVDWSSDFLEFEKIDPDEIYILSSTEVYIEEVWRHLFEYLQPWLERKNKKAILINPYLHDSMVRANILAERSYSMVESVLPLYRDKIYEDLNISRVFSCYMLRASESRARTLDTLIRTNITNQGYLTYHNPNVRAYDGFEYWNKHPLVLNQENYSKNNITHYTDPLFYRNSFIDIVTETSYETGRFFMTEKTIRPICHEKPFIVVGPPGFHKRYLRVFFDLELYDDIIDYSFDDESDLQTRINAVIENIKRLISIKKKLQKRYHGLLPKLQYNKKILHDIYYDKFKIIPKSLQHLLDKSVEYEFTGFINTSLVQLILDYRAK